MADCMKPLLCYSSSISWIPEGTMPIYEYRCIACEQIFEEWQKSFEEADPSCPVCGGDSERVISNTTFVLKGGGWYVSEYGRNSAGSQPNTNGAASAPAESGGTTSPGTQSATGTTDAVASGGSAS